MLASHFTAKHFFNFCREQFRDDLAALVRRVQPVERHVSRLRRVRIFIVNRIERYTIIFRPGQVAILTSHADMLEFHCVCSCKTAQSIQVKRIYACVLCRLENQRSQIAEIYAVLRLCAAWRAIVRIENINKITALHRIHDDDPGIRTRLLHPRDEDAEGTEYRIRVLVVKTL